MRDAGGGGRRLGEEEKMNEGGGRREAAGGAPAWNWSRFAMQNRPTSARTLFGFVMLH
jgi:hypothetical protein